MRACTGFMGGLILAAFLAGSSAMAQEVKVGEADEFIPLTEDKPYIHVIDDGRAVKIQRVQDPDYELKGYFAKTVRKCPPFCLRPMSADPRVTTIGELELFDFMENELRDGKGLLIDARTPSWYQKGTIPGSVNIPFTELSKEPDDPAWSEIFRGFGAKTRTDPGMVTKLLEQWGYADTSLKTEKWDFTDAKLLALWCNGPTCGQSPRAIKGMLEAGYPPEKLLYYRGGMQMWLLFGLTTVIPHVDTAGQTGGAEKTPE